MKSISFITNLIFLFIIGHSKLSFSSLSAYDILKDQRDLIRETITNDLKLGPTAIFVSIHPNPEVMGATIKIKAEKFDYKTSILISDINSQNYQDTIDSISRLVSLEIQKTKIYQQGTDKAFMNNTANQYSTQGADVAAGAKLEQGLSEPSEYFITVWMQLPDKDQWLKSRISLSAGKGESFLEKPNQSFIGRGEVSIWTLEYSDSEIAGLNRNVLFQFGTIDVAVRDSDLSSFQQGDLDLGRIIFNASADLSPGHALFFIASLRAGIRFLNRASYEGESIYYGSSPHLGFSLGLGYLIKNSFSVSGQLHSDSDLNQYDHFQISGNVGYRLSERTSLSLGISYRADQDDEDHPMQNPLFTTPQGWGLMLTFQKDFN